MSTRRLAALLAVLELAVAAYLEIERARGRSVACPIGGGGCETVQQSRYSHLAGIPLPVLGLAGAAAMLATTLIDDARARTAALIIAVTGALFSLYLAGLQAFQIHAYCAWCLSSAVIWIALAATTGIGWYRALPKE
ncbi:MAG TPA: vitamin K epoxide reductase family protein [Gaiellales bacterium]|nr:vitamin K epoxide reductase family protein [Gaiellales bacterium]